LPVKARSVPCSRVTYLHSPCSTNMHTLAAKLKQLEPAELCDACDPSCCSQQQTQQAIVLLGTAGSVEVLMEELVYRKQCVGCGQLLLIALPGYCLLLTQLFPFTPTPTHTHLWNSVSCAASFSFCSAVSGVTSNPRRDTLRGVPSAAGRGTAQAHSALCYRLPEATEAVTIPCSRCSCYTGPTMSSCMLQYLHS
jgi:hypothetical protein